LTRPGIFCTVCGAASPILRLPAFDFECLCRRHVKFRCFITRDAVIATVVDVTFGLKQVFVLPVYLRHLSLPRFPSLAWGTAWPTRYTFDHSSSNASCRYVTGSPCQSHTRLHSQSQLCAHLTQGAHVHTTLRSKSTDVVLALYYLRLVYPFFFLLFIVPVYFALSTHTHHAYYCSKLCLPLRLCLLSFHRR